MSRAGVAYVDVRGDLSNLNRSIAAAMGPGKLGTIGKVGGAGLAAGFAAAFGAFKIGEKFDDAFDRIRVGTGKTGKSLKGLEKDFKEVVKTTPTDFGNASKAIADLNTRLGLSGKPLQKMSRQMLELSRLTETDLGTNIESVTRTFGDWGIAVAKQPKTLDAMFRASQATGISVDKLGSQLVKYGAPLRQMGFGFETAAATLGKFEKEGVNAELVMGSLRIALGKMARAGIEDPAKALAKITDEIKNAGSAGEANKLALETFGARAGPDMAAAIREGRFELGDLYGQIKGGKETIEGAAKDTEDFSEKWLMFKNKVLVEVMPLATGVYDAVAKVMDKVGDLDVSAKLQPVKDFFKGVAETFKDEREGGAGIGAAIVTSVGEAFRSIDWATVLDFGKSMREAVTGGIKDVFAGVSAADVLGGSVKFARDIVDTLFSPGFWTRHGGDVAALALAIIPIGKITKIPGLKRLADLLWIGLKVVFQTVGKMLGAVTRGVGKELLDQLIKGIGKMPLWVGVILTRAGQMIKSFLPGMRGAGGRLGQAILDGLEATGRGIVKVGAWLVGKLWAGIKGAFGILKTAGKWAGDKIRDGVAGLWKAFYSLGGFLLRKLKDGLINAPLSGLKALGSRIGKAIQGGIGKIKATLGIGGTTGALAFGKDKGGFGAVTNLASKFGNIVTSGYRPGDKGWHGQNRARDYAGGNMMGFAKAVAKQFGTRLLELIHTPLGWGIKNGKQVSNSFFGPAVMADHYDHVHVAMARGGFLKGTGLKDKIPVLAAPSEAILNRHQQVPVETALQETFGFGLDSLFDRIKTPHFAARGKKPSKKERERRKKEAARKRRERAAQLRKDRATLRDARAESAIVVAEMSPETADDIAAYEKRIALNQKRLKQTQRALRKKGLSPARRAALIQKRTDLQRSISGDQGSISDLGGGAADDSGEPEETEAQRLLREAIEAQTAALQAETEARQAEAEARNANTAEIARLADERRRASDLAERFSKVNTGVLETAFGDFLIGYLDGRIGNAFRTRSPKAIGVGRA